MSLNQQDYIVIISIASILSPTVVVGVVSLLLWVGKQALSEKIKNSIKSEYDQRLESHKDQLKLQSTTELEKLRSQLSLVALERNIVFSALHEKRADTVSTIYAQLVITKQCLSNYVNPVEFGGEPSSEERYKDLVTAHALFHKTFTTKAIFLPEEIAKKLESLNQALVTIGNQFRLVVQNPSNPNPQQLWGTLAERVDGEIRESMSSLAKEFRRLLGDS